MSVALWFEREGEHRRLCSDWGPVNTTYVRIDRDPVFVGSTILTTECFVAEVIMYGPKLCNGGMVSVDLVGQRTFWHWDGNGKRWTWELFPAHFRDGKPNIDFMLGRWPD